MENSQVDFYNLPHEDRFQAVFRGGFWTDFTYVLGQIKEKVKIHKVFIKTGSPILCKMIEKVESGGRGHLDLPDVDPHCFKILLEFLYTGKCPNILVADAFPVLKLSNDFEVPGLRNHCMGLLGSVEFTDENVLQTFQAAMEHANQEIISSSLKYVCRNGVTILDRDEFSLLRLECLMEIIQQDDLNVKDESQVFEAVYSWGIAECKRQNLDESEEATLRNMVRKPLKHVRFPLMDKETFALHIATRNVLNMDETLAILTSFLVSDDNRSRLPGGRFTSTPRCVTLPASNPSKFKQKERHNHPPPPPPPPPPSQDKKFEVVFCRPNPPELIQHTGAIYFARDGSAVEIESLNFSVLTDELSLKLTDITFCKERLNVNWFCPRNKAGCYGNGRPEFDFYVGWGFRFGSGIQLRKGPCVLSVSVKCVPNDTRRNPECGYNTAEHCRISYQENLGFITRKGEGRYEKPPVQIDNVKRMPAIIAEIKFLAEI